MNLKEKILLLSLSLISFLTILVLVIQQNQFLLRIDFSISAFVNTLHFPLLDKIMLFITSIDNIYQSLYLFIIFAIILITKRKKVYFYILTLATFLGSVLPVIIKFLVERARPISSYLIEPGFSFPSGHATISIVYMFSVIFLLIPLIKSHFLKTFLFILSVIIFPLIAISRIYLSVHWTSDVEAGLLLGLSSYILSDIIIKKYIA